MSHVNLYLAVEPKLFENFLQHLQKGVKVTARIGSTIRSFLCDDLGLSSEYADKRIQTLFLNGKAVDNLDTTYLKENSILALSAAMPGLLGATLRKGGYYARMRNEISHQAQGQGIAVHEGFILLKLFNLLPAEIGPAVFERGIWFKGEDLSRLLKELPAALLSKCMEARVDDQSVNPMSLKGKNWDKEMILLKIKSTPSAARDRGENP